MNNINRIAALPAALALCVGLAACADGGSMANASSSGSSMSSSSMSGTASMSANPMVGGQPMLASRDIVSNAVNSADHTTLVAAVKAAGLVDTLQSPGPFTVFAPTNDAFDALPAGTVDTLVQPANKATLTRILTYHVVPGRMTMADLKQKIEMGGGRAMLTTAEGGTLTAMMNGPSNIVLQDAKGGTTNISTYDVYQSNGVIHVVDSVLMPGM